jgi:hypothetical protein
LALQWLLTGTAAVVAVMALVRARRLSKRLERLTESYWELRYEHGQLRARVNRIDPETARQPTEPVTKAESTAFVPLSSLRR